MSAMANRQTDIHVPDRRDDEPNATRRQIQAIRDLVDGTALHGYRLDYRRLGTDQAQTIISQLQQFRDRQPRPEEPARGHKPATTPPSARDRALTAAAAIALLAGGASVFIACGQNPDADSATNEQPTANDNAPKARGYGDQDINLGSSNDTPDKVDFFGNQGDTNTDPRSLAPQQTTPAPVPFAPQASPDTLKQIDSIEKLIVDLSQYTRKDYAPAIRAQSTAAMNKILAGLTTGLTALDDEDPGLAKDIQNIINQYNDPAIDGPSMRLKIDNLRQRLDNVRKAL